ncbi:MAG: exonuclease SbcCD subunit D [Ruminococcaceae bacterium]|nr:exonuclease SbcCD subunit D [Oscillospiraceae bacterium]
MRKMRAVLALCSDLWYNRHRTETVDQERTEDGAMKLLHTGDLHLDSAFCGTDSLRAEDRREAQRQVLIRIFECAEREACDLILIAGDLFDSVCVTPETEELCLRLFRRSACPVVIAPGNHDPYTKGSFYRREDLPEQVYVFNSPEVQCFEFPDLGVRVFGYAFLSAVLQKSPLAGVAPPEANGMRNLLCAHADLSDPLSRSCPLTVGDIVRFGIDYAALGHIHNRRQEDSFGNTCIRYCGFAEGRSFDELGDGGVLIVTLEEGRMPSVERRIVSERRYVIAELALDGCAEAQEVRQKLSEAISSIDEPKGTNLRLELVGAVDADCIGDPETLSAELRGELASLELRNMTVPTADGAYLAKDPTLRGAFYRELLPGLVDADPKVRAKAALALQIGLAAMENRRIPGQRDEE